MNNRIMTIVAVFAAVSVVQATAFAAVVVVTDPAVFSSPAADIIDPDDTRNVSFNAAGTGFTTQATIEGVSGIQSLQDYSGFTGKSDANSYIVNFTSATRPDLQFTFSGSPSGSDTAINNASFATSASSSLRLGTSAASTAVSLRIDMGSWNGTTFSTGVNSVQELAFTLAGSFSRVDGSVAISYFDAGDNVLSAQTLTSTVDSVAGYTGFQSGSANVSYVTVAYTAPATNAGILGLDDLAFSTIPEPASLALMGLGGLLMLRRRSV